MLSGPYFLPGKPIKKILVTLHGYGADGEDLYECGLKIINERKDIALYSPNAIEEFEFSKDRYQWFGLPDLASLTLEKGIHKALPTLFYFIDSLIKKHDLSYQDVYLFGFSQGAMMALTALYYKPFGAVIASSGIWVKPFKPEIEAPKTPVLLIHGMQDTVVPYPSCTIAEAMLKQDGISVDVLTRPTLGHQIDSYSLEQCSLFLQNLVK